MSVPNDNLQTLQYQQQIAAQKRQILTLKKALGIFVDSIGDDDDLISLGGSHVVGTRSDTLQGDDIREAEAVDNGNSSAPDISAHEGKGATDDEGTADVIDAVNDGGTDALSGAEAAPMDPVADADGEDTNVDDMSDGGGSDDSEEDGPLSAVWDSGDAVYRCTECNWEVLDGVCQSRACGMEFHWTEEHESHVSFADVDSQAFHPDRLPPRGTTPVLDVSTDISVTQAATLAAASQFNLDSALLPAAYAAAWNATQLLARGATPMMCGTYMLTFDAEKGIIARADARVDMRLMDAFRLPGMELDHAWYFHLGQRVQLHPDDENGREFMFNLLEDVLAYPLRAGLWTTTETEPGVWVTRPTFTEEDFDEDAEIWAPSRRLWLHWRVDEDNVEEGKSTDEEDDVDKDEDKDENAAVDEIAPGIQDDGSDVPSLRYTSYPEDDYRLDDESETDWLNDEEEGVPLEDIGDPAQRIIYGVRDSRYRFKDDDEEDTTTDEEYDSTQGSSESSEEEEAVPTSDEEESFVL